MIQPINNHILIDPLAHESFISSTRDTFQEIGVVVALPDELNSILRKGDRVFFDAWLAKKYPKSDTDGEFYWLVKYEDITAVEHDIREQV